MKTPIYIDTDLGTDDVIAICMLVASKKYTIRGISVINGVSTIKQGVRNLNRILLYLGISCPIYFGADQKTQKSNVQFPATDRKRANNLTLLSNIFLPSAGLNPVLPLSSLINKLDTETRPVKIFAIGPLTNIATVFTKQKQRITDNKTLIIMGGAVFAKGNIGPNYNAEYNIRLDVRAAQDVFNYSMKKIVIPIDATSYTPALLQNNSASNTYLINFMLWLKSITPVEPAGKIIQEVILNNISDFNFFYDPLAAAILIDPSIIKSTQYKNISVSTNRQTFGKLFLSKKKSKNEIVLSVDAAKFYNLLKKLIR